MFEYESMDPFDFCTGTMSNSSSVPQHQINEFQAQFGKPIQIVYHYQGALSDFDHTRSRHPFRSWQSLPRKISEINDILGSRGQMPLSHIHYLQYIHPFDPKKIVTSFELSNGSNIKWIRFDEVNTGSSSYKFSVFDPMKNTWTYRKGF
jgi:hypothetical protein